MPVFVASVPKRRSGVAKVARASSLVALPLLPTFMAGVVVVLVGVVVVVLVGVVRIVVATVVVVGALLVPTFELVDLLVSASKRVRNPFRPAIMVDSFVVASPGFGGVGSSFAGSLVVLLDVGGKHFDVPVAPDRSTMNAFDWRPSDGSISLYASSWSERRAVIGLPSVDVNARVLVLSKFGEGSAKAADLVVEVGFG